MLRRGLQWLVVFILGVLLYPAAVYCVIGLTALVLICPTYGYKNQDRPFYLE